MAGEDDDRVVTQDFHPFFRIYKSGRLERLKGNDTVPPSVDPITSVSSKDVTLFPYSVDVTPPTNVVSARLFLPKLTDSAKKLPILVYFHGGGFLMESPFSPIFHGYLSALVAGGNFLAVSVNYRLVPEHVLPIAYEDSWTALKWVLSHASGSGPEHWLIDHGDFDKVSIAGDSAGANITHQMAIKAGEEGFQLSAAVLVHPYFMNNEGAGPLEQLWRFACPSTSGLGDPLINPVAAGPARLGKIGVRRVLVCVAEKDYLRRFGLEYYRELRLCGWGGVAEMMETEGEEHVFHLLNPDSEKAVELRTRLVEVINGNPATPA